MLYVPIPFTSIGDFDDTELSSSMTNPLDNVRDNDRQQFRKRYNMIGSFAWDIIDGLEFRTEEGLITIPTMMTASTDLPHIM